MLLRRVRIDPALAGNGAVRLPCLQHGPVEIAFRAPLTVLVGENGSGKTTVLEAIAARCGIRPGGGQSYRQFEDERPGTALSAATVVDVAPRLQGFFLRADRLHELQARAGRLPFVQMGATPGKWREAEAQSRGEGVLSLLTARVDASEAMLFLLDEPETGLSPQRQMALLVLLDAIVRDGRSQAVVATHSPMLMSHPGADCLWVDEDGIDRRPLDEIEHWRTMRRFMRDPAAALARLLE